MQTLNLSFVPPRTEGIGIEIEDATGCDGSACRQPIFREDGTLHYVAPHAHLIEWISGVKHCYAVLCDFPADSASGREVFGNYPPAR